MSGTIHLSNGIILTDPESGHLCHSITITDGKVVNHDIPLPEGASHIDLDGCYAIPGFIDSHLHLVLAAKGLGEVDLRECDSIESFQKTLLKAKRYIEQGQWLVGSGWSEHRFGEYPNKSWFPVTLDIPSICYRVDFHTAIVNSALLDCLDINRIKKMTGGRQVEDGIVMEDALFEGLIPILPKSSPLTRLRRTKQAIQKLHSQGITLVGSMEHKGDIDSVLVPLQQEQCIRMRIMCMDEPTKKMLESCMEMQQDDFLQITGFKTFLDGTLGSRTAKMYADWSDAAGSGIWVGKTSSGALQKWISTVSDSGYAPVLHAIGDEAVGCALNQLQDVDALLIPRIEHAQCIAECDLSNIREKWFGVQPLHQPEDARIAKSALGEERIPELHNWRRMIDAGAILSFGSDWPVAPPHPIEAISVAIEQGVTPQEALVASTRNGARSLRSNLAGHLEIGAYGDLAILDLNPLQCDWKKVLPSVTMTIQEGHIVYTKE